MSLFKFFEGWFSICISHFQWRLRQLCSTVLEDGEYSQEVGSGPHFGKTPSITQNTNFDSWTKCSILPQCGREEESWAECTSVAITGAYYCILRGHARGGWGSLSDGLTSNSVWLTLWCSRQHNIQCVVLIKSSIRTVLLPGYSSSNQYAVHLHQNLEADACTAFTIP